jgi:hypothetical protein
MRITLLQISTCAGFQALALANTKLIRGHVTTGIVAMMCRHELWRAESLVDLQKGERYVILHTSIITLLMYFDSYANVDLAFWGGLRGVKTNVVNGYDIACQWSKHLFERATKMPIHLLPSIEPSMLEHKLPKLHAEAHGWKCQPAYSLNYAKGVGRWEAEGHERGWGSMNHMATSTAEMGPGHRREVLDDAFQYHNFKKITNIGLFYLLNPANEN